MIWNQLLQSASLQWLRVAPSQLNVHVWNLIGWCPVDDSLTEIRITCWKQLKHFSYECKERDRSVAICEWNVKFSFFEQWGYPSQFEHIGEGADDCVSGGKSVCEIAWRGIVVYSYYLF